MNCFIPLMLDADPLKNSKKIFEERKELIYSTIDLSEVKENVVDSITSLGVKIEKVVVWNWILADAEIKKPHTDGNYNGRKKRRSGINWSLTTDSALDFWEIDKVSAEPEYEITDITHYTFWNTNGNPTCTWTGTYPALVNPQVPHKVRSLNNSVIRQSVIIVPDYKLEFLEVAEKLKKIWKLQT